MQKTNWNSYHSIVPTFFFVFGIILNGLCVITFTQPKTHRSGTGVYLLANSISNQFVFTILLIRVVYLYISHQSIISPAVNIILCKSLPYLMMSFYYMSLSVITLVAIERALTVTLPMRLL